MSKRRKVLIAVTLLVAMLLLAGCGSKEIVSGGAEDWRVIPLQSVGNLVYFEGPDMTEINKYTYYARGQWVALEFEGYLAGVNVWSIPDALKDEKPNWESNENWTLDFEWIIDTRGEPPVGSYLGTSSE